MRSANEQSTLANICYAWGLPNTLPSPFGEINYNIHAIKISYRYQISLQGASSYNGLHVSLVSSIVRVVRKETKICHNRIVMIDQITTKRL